MPTAKNRRNKFYKQNGYIYIYIYIYITAKPNSKTK